MVFIENNPKCKNYPVNRNHVGENTLIKSGKNGHTLTTVAQMIGHYNQGLQSISSKYTLIGSMENGGYCGRRLHRVQQLSAGKMNRKLLYYHQEDMCRSD